MRLYNDDEKNLVYALKSLYKDFVVHIVETVPNYVDGDFNLNNFITYIESIDVNEESPYVR